MKKTVLWATTSLLLFVGCQAQAPNTITTFNPTQLSNQSISTPIQSQQLPIKEANGQVETSQAGDQLKFVITMPQKEKGFSTQALDFNEIQCLRLWVRGSDIDTIWNEEGHVDLHTSANGTTTLTVKDVPKGQNRVVTAQGYTADMQPVPGATLKAVYSSSESKDDVDVVLNWRSVPTANIIEYLIDNNSPLAATLDTQELQQEVIDPMIYGSETPSSNYVVHPSVVDAASIADALEQSKGKSLPAPAEFEPLAAQVPFVIRDENGQPYEAGDIILTLNDPASTSMTLTSGQDIIDIPQVAFGTWTATITAVDYPEITTEELVTIQQDGTIEVARGTEEMPIHLPFVKPTLDTIFPNTGSTLTPTTVTLTGEGFTPETTVRVGDLDITDINFIDNTHLTIAVPTSLVHGKYDVTVTNIGNQIVQETEGFAIASGIQTFAGNGYPGNAIEGASPQEAILNSVSSVITDPNGNVIMADTQNMKIRMIPVQDGTYYGQAMTAGQTYTIAGTGTQGTTGDNGPALNANLNQPMGLALKSDGSLFFSENNKIRLIAPDGKIKAFSGYSGYTNDGRHARLTKMTTPTGLFVDQADNLYICISGQNKVRMVPAFSGVYFGKTMNTARVYTIAGDGTTDYEIADENAGGPMVSLNNPTGITGDDEGNIYITEANGHRVRKLSTDGMITTIAGTGTADYTGDEEQALNAQFNTPTGLAFNNNKLFISDSNNHVVRELDLTTGVIETIAGNGNSGYAGDNGAAMLASLNQPAGLSFDHHGNLFIADQVNHNVRIVLP